MRAASPEIFSMESDQRLHISSNSSGGLGGRGIISISFVLKNFQLLATGRWLLPTGQVSGVSVQDSGFRIQDSDKGRCQVSVFRFQDYEPDDVENDQNPHSVIFFLTPDT
jgi:hypothetical protein